MESVGPAFHLSVQRVGHYDLDNLGGDASLFLTKMTADHWASPTPDSGQGALLSRMGKHGSLSSTCTDPDQSQQSPKPIHSTISMKRSFESNIPSPSTHRASPLSLKIGDKHSLKMSAIETPQNGSRTSQLRLPNSGDSMSSVQGSLSSRASINKQVHHGKSKLGTLKLTLEERKKLAMEGKRLLNAARAKSKKVISPPTTITTSRPALS